MSVPHKKTSGDISLVFLQWTLNCARNRHFISLHQGKPWKILECRGISFLSWKILEESQNKKNVLKISWNF